MKHEYQKQLFDCNALSILCYTVLDVHTDNCHRYIYDLLNWDGNNSEGHPLKRATGVSAY